MVETVSYLSGCSRTSRHLTAISGHSLSMNESSAQTWSGIATTTRTSTFSVCSLTGASIPSAVRSHFPQCRTGRSSRGITAWVLTVTLGLAQGWR